VLVEIYHILHTCYYAYARYGSAVMTHNNNVTTSSCLALLTKVRYCTNAHMYAYRDSYPTHFN